MYVSEYDPKSKREIVRRLPGKTPFAAPFNASFSKTAPETRISLFTENRVGAEEILLVVVLYAACFRTQEPDLPLILALLVLLFCDRFRNVF